MNFLDDYKHLVGLLNISSLTNERIQWLGSLAGAKIDTMSADIIVEMVKSAGEKLNTNSIGKVLADTDIRPEIEKVFQALVSKSQNPVEEAPSSSPKLVHVDSLIECAHCGKRTHIRSAIERKTRAIENK